MAEKNTWDQTTIVVSNSTTKSRSINRSITLPSVRVSITLHHCRRNNKVNATLKMSSMNAIKEHR